MNGRYCDEPASFHGSYNNVTGSRLSKTVNEDQTGVEIILVSSTNRIKSHKTFFQEHRNSSLHSAETNREHRDG
jgi:hypothetical protein